MDEFHLDLFGINKEEKKLPNDLKSRYLDFYKKYKDRIFYQVNSDKTLLCKCKFIDPSIPAEAHKRRLTFKDRFYNMRFERFERPEEGVSLGNIYFPPPYLIQLKWIQN